MKTLDKIIVSPTPPNNTNVAWFDGKNIKLPNKGKWKGVGGEGSGGGVTIVNSEEELQKLDLPLGSIASVAIPGSIKEISIRDLYQPTADIVDTSTGTIAFPELLSSVQSIKVNAPELPATELYKSCYKDMFRGCTSLVNAPILPATTLDDSCYMNMFYECTSLSNVPELPATILTKNCYYAMFHHCSQIKYIKMLATDISATDAMYEWVYGVSPTGTFVKNSAATWDIVGVSGVPEGWTVEYADS